MSVSLLTKKFKRLENIIHITQHQHCTKLLLCIHWMYGLTTKELWVVTIFHFHKMWEYHVIFALPINAHFYLPMLDVSKIVLYDFVNSTNKSYCTLNDGLRSTIMEQTYQPFSCISCSWHVLCWNRAEFPIRGSLDLNID